MNRPIKFDNYLYYSICEISQKLYKKSGYQTYQRFCESFKNSINTNNFSPVEEKFVSSLTDELVMIYGLDEEEIGAYIANYFLEDKYIIFEQPVLVIKSIFPYS